MVLMFSGVGLFGTSAASGFFLRRYKRDGRSESRNSQSKSGFSTKRWMLLSNSQGSKKSKAATLVRWSGL